MDGIHDLGGFVGFGGVDHQGIDDGVFGTAWERRAMGMTFVTFVRGLSNGGQFRHAIERMDPGHYITSRYYEHWFTAVATRLVEEGVVSLDELEQRAGGQVPLSRPVHEGAEPEAAALAAAAPTFAPAVGDLVRVAATPRVGHTRCPGYVRGRTGTVVRVDPATSLADLEAHLDERRSEAVCCVRFDAAQLWGPTAAPAAVHVDLSCSYLAPASEEMATR